MRVAQMLLLLAALSFATSAASNAETHGQLRKPEPAATVAPLPILVEGLASIGNAYQLEKHAEAVQQEQLKVTTAAPPPTPASTSVGHTPTPTVVVKPLSCRSTAKAPAASDAAILARLTAIEAVLEDIQQLLEARRA